MKGFKKDGKFRPTGNKSKSSLSKSDLKNVSSHSGVGHDMRNKKTITEPNVKIEWIGWDFGEENDIKYMISPHGSVKIVGGVKAGIEKLGGKILTDKQIVELSKKDPEFVFNESDYHFMPNDTEEKKIAFAYGLSKQSDNTYNYSSNLDPTLQLGKWIIDDDEKYYISFSEHRGGDVRGNYDQPIVMDVTDVDTGASGEPDTDLLDFLYPTINWDIEINGKQFVVQSNGGNADEYVERDTGAYNMEDAEQKTLDESDHLELFEKKAKELYPNYYVSIGA